MLWKWTLTSRRCIIGLSNAFSWIRSTTSQTMTSVAPAWSGWCSHGLRGSLRDSWFRAQYAASSERATSSTFARLPRSLLTSSDSTRGSRRHRPRTPSLNPSTRSVGNRRDTVLNYDTQSMYIVQYITRLRKQKKTIKRNARKSQ